MIISCFVQLATGEGGEDPPQMEISLYSTFTVIFGRVSCLQLTKNNKPKNKRNFFKLRSPFKRITSFHKKISLLQQVNIP